MSKGESMNEITHKIVKLLIEVGLTPVIAEELSEKIDLIYKQDEQERLSQRGKKGGSAKTTKPKGFAYMKKYNPEAFAEIQSKRGDITKYNKAHEKYQKAGLKLENRKKS